MDIGFLLRGLVIGFSIAAPVGPIGVLCIRRTLAKGRVYGLISGLGAATADAIYGCIAAFGLSFVADFLINQQLWIRFVGGVFLCFLGIKTLLSKPAEQNVSTRRNSVAGDYVSTFLLTITNPMTILSFMAIFAGFGIANTSADYVSAAVLVSGVFAGSVLWWFLLSGVVGVFRSRFKPEWLLLVNIISGLIIFGFGLIVFLSLAGL